MARVLVWDLPTRLFHWVFAGGVAAAAAIALGLGDDSPLFAWHGIIGLILVAAVGMRLIWGLIGTRYARWGSFLFGPGATVGYFIAALLGRDARHVGHNPGSAAAILAMLAIFIGLAVSGILLGRGHESVKEVHELLAYAMLAVAGVHILGVAAHMVRHRENIVRGMVDGRKEAPSAAGIRSAQPLAAAAFLLIGGAWAVGLVRGYDPATQATMLPLLNVQLQLGEAEDEDRHDRSRDRRRHDDDADDDDE